MRLWDYESTLFVWNDLQQRFVFSRCGASTRADKSFFLKWENCPWFQSKQGTPTFLASREQGPGNWRRQTSLQIQTNHQNMLLDKYHQCTVQPNSLLLPQAQLESAENKLQLSTEAVTSQHLTVALSEEPGLSLISLWSLSMNKGIVLANLTSYLIFLRSLKINLGLNINFQWWWCGVGPHAVDQLVCSKVPQSLTMQIRG